MLDMLASYHLSDSRLEQALALLHQGWVLSVPDSSPSALKGVSPR
jgi:hypothetical protein